MNKKIKNNKNKDMILKTGAAFVALTALSGTSAMAAPGDSVKLEQDTSIHMNAYDAKYNRNSVSKYTKGNYFIYSEHDATGTVNITSTKGVPGGWVKSSTLDEQATSKPQDISTGAQIEVSNSLRAYTNAYDAQNGRNSTTTYSPGTYYVFNEHKATNTVNITKRKGQPGGWVKKDALEGKVTDSGSTNSGITGTTKTLAGVNFRSSPSADNRSNIIGYVPRGTTIKAEKHNNYWAKVEYQGKIGYVSLRYTELGDTPSQNSSNSNTAQSTSYVLPLPRGSYWVSSEFGYRIHPISGDRRLHGGIDLAAAGGTNIYSAAAGTVVSSTYSSGYGNYVRVRHDDGKETLYAHMSKRNAYVGQRVAQGQTIGYVGTTGNSTGNHLHFEVFVNGTRTNPRNFVKF